MFINRIKIWLRQGGQVLLLSTVCLLCHTACTEELLQQERPQTNRAIQIVASLPDDFITTKAANPKKKFEDGNVIHVDANFKLADNNESTTYACMKYKGGQWTASDGTTLEWPWNAVSGTFTAYYIPPVTIAGKEMKNEDAMSNGANQNILCFSMSDLTNAAMENGTDPMHATHTDVAAESAVHLQFKHLFAKITFRSLGQENNYSGTLREGETLYLTAKNALKDTCAFSRKVDGDKLMYQQLPGKGYIAGKAEKNGENTAYNVTFLIPPTDANTEFRLLFKDFTPYHLISIEKKLEAGHHYSLDITNLADNYWSDDLKEEAWNKDETSIVLTAEDINKYLGAIRDGKEYRKNNIQILDVYKEGENNNITAVVTQLRDVDFNNLSFTPVNISTNITFEGNRHKVKNLYIQSAIDKNGNPGTDYRALFGINDGTIRNLRIEGAKTNESKAKNVGVLVGHNGGTGKIEGVRIDFHRDDKVQGSDMTTFIGGLVGTNEGKITNCTLRGSNVEIGVTNTTTESCYVGGMIGYNSGTSEVQEARIQVENSKVYIKSNIPNAYIGGWAGYSGCGRMEACSTSFAVEAKAGNYVYAGGFTGKLNGVVERCSATGMVTLPTTVTQTDGGGFAGWIASARLNACYAAGTINGGDDKASIGGFVGQIKLEDQATTDVLNCFAIGEVPDNTGLGFIALSSDAAKVSIRNCFSRNRATNFIGNDKAALVNIHHNGNANGVPVSAADLNVGIPDGGFNWTDTPALYGTGFPYFIIK